RFLVDVVSGQKTGWFYDHRDNRARMQRYVADRTVLDAFSYTGAWGIAAATAGARQVTCLDSSAAALLRVADNAALNGVGDRVDTCAGDVFETLKALQVEGTRFDVILLDPPALIKRRKDLAAGTRAYQRLNQLALRLLADDGILVTSSCSFHLPASGLQQAVVKAARAMGQSLQLLERGHQAADHPVHPAMPETDYLKTLFVRPMPGL
ncbi:MAG TPA: class I SAM-dependent methyltransferase, partial [Pseudodesulfovibrio sp.]|nr:class I SAM-dependent methyltransferase [Pseudodesulfovibrio sp.]